MKNGSNLEWRAWAKVAKVFITVTLTFRFLFYSYLVRESIIVGTKKVNSSVELLYLIKLGWWDNSNSIDPTFSETTVDLSNV